MASQASTWAGSEDNALLGLGPGACCPARLWIHYQVAPLVADRTDSKLLTNSANSFIKYSFETLLSQRGAFKVLDRAYFIR
jgi:hypothetical protein